MSYFYPDWPGTLILQISASHVAAITSIHHHIQPLVEMGSHELFAKAGDLSYYHPILYIPSARITDMIH
jgi:hypothetical protein